MNTDLRLLEDYVGKDSQDAFATLVERHLNLVYAAALRQVRSSQLAEEVAQSVFADLARHAGKLKSNTILTAWLYRVTRRTAVDVVRRESRRQLREQIAAETTMNSTPSEWNSIEPLLDEAMESLEEPERAALLLRYFENKSLREVGQALGTSDDAAQKRISRAVERLREFFGRHGISIGAGGLAVAICANAAPAAPAGLALAISTATLGGKALSTAIAATKTIAMTTTQKAVIGAALVAALGTGIYGVQQSAQLRSKLQLLEQARASLAVQVDQLTAENERLSSQLTQARGTEGLPKNPANELLRLRGVANLNAREISELKSALAQGGQIPDYLTKVLNKYYTGYTSGEQQSQTNGALNQLRKMSAKLSLTPEQEQHVRQILLANIEARTEMRVAQWTGGIPFEEVRTRKDKIDEEESNALASVLSPEQMTAYQQMEAEEADTHYQSWAQQMARQMKSLLKLSPEQQKQVASVLYSLKPGEGGENIPLYANAREQIEMRMQALASVLSPEQLQGYRQKLLADTEEHNDLAKLAQALAKSKSAPQSPPH